MKPPPQRPRHGTIKRAVYDELQYNTGMSVTDIRANCPYNYHQIHRVLSALLESGLVEKLERPRSQYGEILWFLVGASRDNDPVSRPAG